MTRDDGMSSKYRTKSRKNHEVRKKDTSRRNKDTGHVKHETKVCDKGFSVTWHNSVNSKKGTNKPRDYSLEARKKRGVCYDFKKKNCKRGQKCLFSHEADGKAEYNLVEMSNTRPPILTKNYVQPRSEKMI